jgi:hypothetical protein
MDLNTDQGKLRIGQTFLQGLSKREGNLLRSILHSEVVWSMPGDSLLSGLARGVEAVIERAELIVDYGMQFELRHIQLGRDGVALSLHNTARRGNLVFDEELVTVLRLHVGSVIAIDTYMSDVAMVDAFFVPFSPTDTRSI